MIGGGKYSPVPSVRSASSFRDLTSLLEFETRSLKSSKIESPLLLPCITNRSSREKGEKVQQENELLVVSTEEIIDGKIIPR